MAKLPPLRRGGFFLQKGHAQMTRLSPEAIELVRVEGAIARQIGELGEANPYPKGTKEHRYWTAGWTAAPMATGQPINPSPQALSAPPGP